MDVFMRVSIGSQTIWENNNVRLLGITIDSDLKCGKQLPEVCKKANWKVSALSRLRKFLRFEKRNLIFKALIESRF